MIIRQQKTSVQTGNHKVEFPGIIQKLLPYWVFAMRNIGKNRFNLEHQMAFFNLNTGKPFNQPSFSKYTAAAFRNISGHPVNIQLIRKILAEGVSEDLIRFMLHISADYLKDHDSPEEYQYLASAMMTGVTSLKRSYYRDGLQRQSQQKVSLSLCIGLHCPCIVLHCCRPEIKYDKREEGASKV